MPSEPQARLLSWVLFHSRGHGRRPTSSSMVGLSQVLPAVGACREGLGFIPTAVWQTQELTTCGWEAPKAKWMRHIKPSRSLAQLLSRLFRFITTYTQTRQLLGSMTRFLPRFGTPVVGC